MLREVLKDLEILERFAARLCVAFFSVASVLQCPFACSILPESVWGRAACWGVIWGAFCFLSIEVGRESPSKLFLFEVGEFKVGKALADLLVRVLFPAFAFACFSIGALALCKIPSLQTVDPLPSLNLFWELGFFMYGLWCFQNQGRLEGELED